MRYQDLRASPFPAPVSAFQRLLRPAAAKVTCEKHLELCPVTALEDALAREQALLREKGALLAEQELLRSESDHRLLNGLQMVASLLSLQSRAATTPETKAQLSAAAMRVTAVEKVHRRLHIHDGSRTVALRNYLLELCRDISPIGAAGAAPALDILVEGEEVELPATKALSLGFIANELITNAVKHGKGRIVVRLLSTPEGRYVLSVSNDGQALPDEFDPAASKGLGMKIVQSFVRKIDGEFRFTRGAEDQGSCFSVVFT